MSERSRRIPVPLAIAASVVGAEGVVLVLLALAEIAALDGGRLAMGVTTALFFACYGAGLVLGAQSLLRRSSWARSPVVLAQLIQLGVAWSYRGAVPWLSAGLAVVAVVVLVGIFHPRSLAALGEQP
ncbi:hypothetical protein [Nocardioides houyundeii]|uniref:hypothetical protein n=1 Tax=Nocardioides houyundeii TaxID=2045452 RepID=UPI0013B37BF8|nr:hypothetical protein [Nocardioides houyundeii]